MRQEEKESQRDERREGGFWPSERSGRGSKGAVLLFPEPPTLNLPPMVAGPHPPRDGLPSLKKLVREARRAIPLEGRQTGGGDEGTLARGRGRGAHTTPDASLQE